MFAFVFFLYLFASTFYEALYVMYHKGIYEAL